MKYTAKFYFNCKPFVCNYKEEEINATSATDRDTKAAARKKELNAYQVQIFSEKGNYLKTI